MDEELTRLLDDSETAQHFEVQTQTLSLVKGMVLTVPLCEDAPLALFEAVCNQSRRLFTLV